MLAALHLHRLLTLVFEVHEAGCVVNVYALMSMPSATAQFLGVDVTIAEDGAGWLTFLRSLVARWLCGVRLVTSDAHTRTARPRSGPACLASLGNAIGIYLGCHPHPSHPPKASWPWVRTCYTWCLINLIRNRLPCNMIGLSMCCSISCPRLLITAKPLTRACLYSLREPFWACWRLPDLHHLGRGDHLYDVVTRTPPEGRYSIGKWALGVLC